MNPAAFAFWNDGALRWANGVERASVQGGLFVLAVWIVCRVLPRLPPTIRYWLWWLACLKLVVGLVWAVPVALPLLPPPPHLQALAPLPTALPSGATANLNRDGDAGEARPTTPGGNANQARPVSGRPVHLLPDLPHGPSVVQILFVGWALGVWGRVLLAVRERVLLQRLLRNARPLDHTAWGEEARRLAAQFALARAPRLLQSQTVTTPLVACPARPILVLPAGLCETLTVSERRLVLAHELAHVRRGDLWLSWLPVVAHTLFFFFPPAWLATRECAAAREEACDADAVRITGASAACYAAFLLKIVAGDAHAPGGAVLGMASGFFALKRRLLTLKHFTNAKRRGPTRAASALVGVSLLNLVPWRLSFLPSPPASAKNKAAPHPAPTYTIIDLGTLGGRSSHAYAINNVGQVVGSANIYPQGRRGHAFLWHKGRMRDIGRLPGYRSSLAVGINNHGQAVASTFKQNHTHQAFVWHQNRAYLGTLPGYRYSRALGINDQGSIVGGTQTGARDAQGAQTARAFLWRPLSPFQNRGTLHDLGTLGGRSSQAHAVNNRDQIVGKADLRAVFAPDKPGGWARPTHAFLWHDGVMRDLGTLPGGRNSSAVAINDNAQAVGFSETPNGPRAFVWHNGVMRDLGTLPGGAYSAAHGINNRGQIVGRSAAGPGETARAVLWQNDVPVDLNDRLRAGSGWVLTEARAVNDRGQIVGEGLVKGQRRAFLLTPHGARS